MQSEVSMYYEIILSYWQDKIKKTTVFTSSKIRSEIASILYSDVWKDACIWDNISFKILDIIEHKVH